MDILRAVFKTKTRDEWVAELGDIDACIGPVYSIEEALNDAHAQTRGVAVSSGSADSAFRTLPTFPRISGVEDDQRYPPPTMGEHTDELLRAAGYSEAEIEQFKSGGAI
jgi:crotonobetainyl-CoA:carnitine CoA-transferase CaiB-like acyl-CoA transferase